MTPPLGKFVWFEHLSTDTKKAQAFYGEVFGWRVQDVPMGPTPYQMIAVGDKTVGGYDAPPAGAPAHWISHLLVANAAATCEAVKKAGGKVVSAPEKIGEFGTMARVTDPLGGALCLWQAGKPEDEPTAALPDGAFVWNELWTHDVAKSLAFYQAIAGYSVKTMNMGPAGDYHVLATGEKDRAGVMKSTEAAAPQMWLPYVQVANADATLERAKRSGGETIMPVDEVPGVGRIGIVKDPLGALVGFIQPAT
jgi:uncharacterized protein